MNSNSNLKSVNISEPKKRRRLRVGDPDFEPPDGGWGWLVIFACGLSNCTIFPMFQQFGLVFGERLIEIGITNTQTTAIINLNLAFTACVALLNGPVYRKFTFRQVAMFGSILVFVSLMITTKCASFYSYVFFYSICYGSGIGLTQTANAIALNTYFKKRRRIATGLSWTTTGMGPIVWPYIINFLKDMYGMEGAVMLFAAFALHAFACSLVLQPVEWHTKFKEIDDPEAAKLLVPKLNKDQKPIRKLSSKSRSAFSSQILYEDNDPVYQGCEITDVGTPNMLKGSDGKYGSKLSLASNKQSKLPSGQNSTLPSKRPSYNNLFDARSKRNSSVNLAADGKERSKRERKHSVNKAAIREEVEDNSDKNNHKQETENFLQVYPNEKDVLKTAAKKLAEYKEEEEKKHTHDQVLASSNNHVQEHEPETKELTKWQKIVEIFDLKLLQDPVFLNLMFGIIIANFAELNFSILTPLVLREFKFVKYQIATFMSLLGAMDLIIRFCAPFAAEKLDWSNKVFFLIGVMSMALGRIVLVHTQTYSIGLVVAAIIGAGKGLRTIFMALIIPQYVPLQRLPAATGIHLATSGIMFIVIGPVVGWVRDLVKSYVITLHILNICTYVVAVSWLLEAVIFKHKEKNAK